MLSRNPTAGAAVPPALQRDTAVLVRPWCPSTLAAPAPHSGTAFIRDPHDQKYAHKNASFAQMTRIAPAKGGALGSHPARDPV